MAANRQINEVALVRQSVFTTYLEEINHAQVASDISLYGVGVGQEHKEHGWISRGFVQYEDVVVPVTPEIAKLEESILDCVFGLAGKKYKIDDMWAVELVKNQSVIAHSHYSNTHINPGEYYSVAYYPQVPEGSAELIFSTEWCGIMQGTVSVKPEVGLLVVFNSYITHMTARHKVEEPRVVLSMNLAPIEPTLTPNADWSVYWDRPVIKHPKIV
jgi:hypothetical protein